MVRGQDLNGRADGRGATMSAVRNVSVLRCMVLAVVILLAGTGVQGPVAGLPLSPEPPDTVPASQGSSDDATRATNDFFPEERNVTDCVGALERPGCGSSSRGGWRQGAILGVLVVAIGFIGWRVSKAVRRKGTIHDA